MALGVVAIPSGLLLIANTRRVTLPWLPLTLLLATLVWESLSLLHAVSLATSWEPLLLQLLLCITFAAAFPQLKAQSEQLAWLTRCLGISTLILCIWGWIQMQSASVGPNLTPYANQGNRNFLAEALLLMLPFSFLGVVTTSRRERWLHLLPIVAAVLLMLQAGSRGVMLGLCAFAFALWPLLSLPRLHGNYLLRAWVAFPAALLILTTAGVVAWKRLPANERKALSETPIPRIQPSMSSTEERFILWRHSIEEANSHPLLGVGAGQWKLVAGRSGIRGFHQGFATRFYTSVHNDHLQVAAELGWIGLLVVWAMPLATLMAGMRGLRRATGWKEAFLLALPMAGLVGFAVAASFGFPRERPLTAVLHLLLCALVWARLPVRELRIPNWLLVGSAFVAGALALSYGAVWLIADAHAIRMEQARMRHEWEIMKREIHLAEGTWIRHEDASATPLAWYAGIASFQQGHPDQALPELRRARTLSPWHPQVLNALGSAAGMAGDLRTSEEAYREAIRLFPDWEEVALNLSAVLMAQGRHDEAADLLSNQYEGPQSAKIKEALEKVQQAGLKP